MDIDEHDLQDPRFFEFLRTKTPFLRENDIDEHNMFLEILAEEDEIPDEIKELFHQFQGQQHSSSFPKVLHRRDLEEEYRIQQLLQDTCDHFCLEEGIACLTNHSFWIDMCFDILKLAAQPDQTERFNFGVQTQEYSFRQRAYKENLIRIRKNVRVEFGTSFNHFVRIGEAFLQFLENYSWECDWLAFMIRVNIDFRMDDEHLELTWEQIRATRERSEYQEQTLEWFQSVVSEMNSNCPIIAIDEQEQWQKNLGELKFFHGEYIFGSSLKTFSERVKSSDCGEKTLVFSAERLENGAIRAYVTFYGFQIRVRSVFQLYRLAEYFFGGDDREYMENVMDRRVLPDEIMDAILSNERLLVWFHERAVDVS